MNRILVVDDEPLTRELVKDLLEAEGYDVATAADGLEGMERLQAERFDLVLTDVWMPRMTGLELLSRLREQEDRPRVVVLTGDDTPQTLLQSVREQADHFMRKPAEPVRLLELVREALGAPPLSGPIEVLSARPHWVELLVPCELAAAHRIQRFMAELEADLLPEVREAVGQVFREMLLNAIEWGGRLDPSRKVRISYVRARKMLLYRISDPGPGFRFDELPHAAVNNPPDRPFEHAQVRQEKGMRPGGFGILIARALVDELLYNEAQNEVIFVKYLPES